MIKLILRAMYADKDGLPIVKDSAIGLGFRFIDKNGNGDIIINGQGQVVADGKGISVVNDIGLLPRWRIPMRLRSSFPSASGKNQYRIFKLSNVEFKNNEIINYFLRLIEEKENPGKGYIAPFGDCEPERYRRAIVSTRKDWKDIGV